MSAVATSLPVQRVRISRRVLAESFATHGGLWLLGAGLLVFLTLPLLTLLVRSFQDQAGAWIGFANFVQYVQTPALARSTVNTVIFASLTTVITIPLAFAFAYAIQRTLHPHQGRVAKHRADPDPRAVAARRAVVHLPLRQPGRG